MARCERCNACESMWSTKDCYHCGFPNEDTRDDDQIAEDDLDMDEYYGEEE